MLNFWSIFLNILKMVTAGLIFLFILFFSIIEWNRKEMEPDKTEIDLLIKNFGDISIKNENDFFRISKLVSNDIKHKDNHTIPLDIENILKYKYGLCYDRSLVLQKIFIYNKIPIRPVYIYFSNNSPNTSFFDFFDKDVQSHNVFEFKYKGNWYMMRTNTAYSKLISIQEFIAYGNPVSVKSKFIRYLNNRNGNFIYPSWIPDIYYFN
jgi:hypothetical protein